MFDIILAAALGIICTEAVTELVVHSEIFRPLREKIGSYSEFTFTLINCGYCFSVWTAAFFSLVLGPNLPCSSRLLNFLVWLLFFHRCSNFLNDFADKYFPNKSSLEVNFDEADKMFGIDSK